MKMQLVTVYFAVAVMLLGVVAAAPATNKDGSAPEVVKKRDIFDEESQLHNLKSGDASSMSMMKSHSSVYSNVNGHEDTKSHSEQQLAENDAVLNQETADEHKVKNPGEEEQSDVKLTQDLPQQQVHHFKTMHNGQVMEEDKRQEDTEPHYSPMDLAEYILRTGDEEGVATAVEGLLSAGLMSDQQAIRYLEEVKLDMSLLKAARQEELKEEAAMKPITEQLALQKKTLPILPPASENAEPELSEADYKELLEKLKVAEFLYNEYSLEEVIYQLAHILFQKSLLQGNAAALESVEKLSKFLEAEVEQGRISPEVQKRVLDVLMASLADSVEEEHSAQLAKSANIRPQLKQMQPQVGQQEVTEISPVDIPQANKRKSS